MEALLVYTARTALCLAVFYLFFKWLLARETFHRLNRVLILGAMLLSMLLPVCVVTVYREVPQMIAEVSTFELPMQVSAEISSFDWLSHLFVLYISGAVLTLVWVGRSLAGVWRIIRRGRRERIDGGVELVLTSQRVAPFSWMKFVVMQPDDWTNCGQIILRHELAHIRLKHSWDCIFADLVCAVQWFNPAVWLLRRDLRALHEFEADRAVLLSGVDPKQYQLLLIRKAVGERAFAVANSLNNSNLKNRITMMLHKSSSRWARAKALLVLPLIGAGMTAFAETKDVPVADATQPKIEFSVQVLNGNPDVDPQFRDMLYVVDGKVVRSIKDLAPDSFASITVLKDPAELAKYGKKAKGKKGVVVITTRKEGQAQQLEEIDLKLNGKIASVSALSEKICRMHLKVNAEGKAVSSAVIRIVGAEQATVTDHEGVAEVEAPVGAKAVVSHDGFESSVFVVPDQIAAEQQVNLKTSVITVIGKPAYVVDGKAAIYVVDGKEVASLDHIDQQHIERVDVHRDPETLAKYRATERGKTMVVLVTLK